MKKSILFLFLISLSTLFSCSSGLPDYSQIKETNPDAFKGDYKKIMRIPDLSNSDKAEMAFSEFYAKFPKTAERYSKMDAIEAGARLINDKDYLAICSKYDLPVDSIPTYFHFTVD